MDTIFTLQQKQLLRVDEAAKILNISRWTVYRWVEDGRLGGTRLGAGSLRIFSNTVAALIDQHCVGITLGSLAGQEAWLPRKAQKPVIPQVIGRDKIRPRPRAVVL
jgi:excisionase family DNA binding protein